MSRDINEPKLDAQVLNQLTEIREKANVTQQEAADYLGVKQRTTISAWECGKYPPKIGRREDIAKYLLHKCKLSDELPKFEKIWSEVAVGQWGWQALSPSEIEELISHTKKSSINTSFIVLGLGTILLLSVIGYMWWASDSDLKEDLIGVYDIQPSNSNSYKLNDSGLSEQSVVYTDRNFTFVEVPESLVDSRYIRTANGDKREGLQSSEFSLEFQIDQDAVVCIGHDRRFTPKERPEWLNEYEILNGGNTQIGFSPPDGEFTTRLLLFCKEAKEGKVILGPNMNPLVEDPDNKTMYVVLILRGFPS